MFTVLEVLQAVQGAGFQHVVVCARYSPCDVLLSSDPVDAQQRISERLPASLHRISCSSYGLQLIIRLGFYRVS